MIPNWYILYTKSKSEKVVFKELIMQEYDVFLPTIEEIRIWKNRQKKIIEKVLFPSYLFVKTYEYKLPEIIQTRNVVTYVNCCGKPSVVSDTDIQNIKKMIGTKQDVSASSEFFVGQKVRVTSGALAGNKGILINQKGKTRFGIKINDINQVVSIEVDESILQKL
ncbi:MAG: UpxY family transcription antiterminator [Bacteroidota bacterium]